MRSAGQSQTSPQGDVGGLEFCHGRVAQGGACGFFAVGGAVGPVAGERAFRGDVSGGREVCGAGAGAAGVGGAWRVKTVLFWHGTDRMGSRTRCFGAARRRGGSEHGVLGRNDVAAGQNTVFWDGTTSRRVRTWCFGAGLRLLTADGEEQRSRGGRGVVRSSVQPALRGWGLSQRDSPSGSPPPHVGGYLLVTSRAAGRRARPWSWSCDGRVCRRRRRRGIRGRLRQSRC